MARKIQASRELYGKFMGTIDTKEKFEAKRLELARHEWARMKESDSRECRNCHTFDGMNLEIQKQRARKQHELALRDKQTCIECHKGIAHKKPEGMTEEDVGS
jgi:cytochrome c-type protein NapC